MYNSLHCCPSEVGACACFINLKCEVLASRHMLSKQLQLLSGLTLSKWHIVSAIICHRLCTAHTHSLSVTNILVSQVTLVRADGATGTPCASLKELNS